MARIEDLTNLLILVIIHICYRDWRYDKTNPLQLIEVFSEKDLAREIEEVASISHPNNEWSIWITAMQTMEGLVFGGFKSMFISFLFDYCILHTLSE